MLTRILILWLLSEGPLHGYRIKKIAGDDAMRFWFPVEAGSIYAVLGTLAKGGFIEQEAVEREGLRPERTRYRITRAGREHLRELLRVAWRTLPRLADPIHMALAAQPELDEPEIAALISERAQALKERLAELERVAASAPAPEMVDRQRRLAQAELEWLDSLSEGS